MTGTMCLCLVSEEGSKRGGDNFVEGSTIPARIQLTGNGYLRNGFQMTLEYLERRDERVMVIERRQKKGIRTRYFEGEDYSGVYYGAQ